MSIEYSLDGTPTAVWHENETGWGLTLIAEHGLAALREEVREGLLQDLSCGAESGEVLLSTSSEEDMTLVRASVRCTRADCMAEAAGLEELHRLDQLLPEAGLMENASAGLHLRTALDQAESLAARVGVDLANDRMWTVRSDDDALVWAYRAGALQLALHELSPRIERHAARRPVRYHHGGGAG
ncbi:hypothetical protein ACIF6H_32450 [Streptomyces microflavus]|uniref:hypothetical protein n=1 Tax=Streptomyces microflavus TaxID=1919 RepID=UPI0037D11320